MHTLDTQMINRNCRNSQVIIQIEVDMTPYIYRPTLPSHHPSTPVPNHRCLKGKC